MGVTLPLEPLELLLDRTGLPVVDLPEELQALYGGSLGFGRPSVIANFVTSIDGVVAIPSLTQSSAIIGDRSDADRFVMGLLRACADVVLVGAGTLRGSPTSIWAAERVYPPAAPAYADLRRRGGMTSRPQVAILTTGGSIDVGHPALETGALILTTANGADRLRGRVPGAAEIAVLAGETAVDLHAAIGFLRDRGHGLILSEAGPTVLGSLLDAGLLDELFLTLSPLLAGRLAGDDRLGLVAGREFLPASRLGGCLTGVRRQEQHLFLRYRFEPCSGSVSAGPEAA